MAGPGVIAVTKQYMINVGIKPDGIIFVLLSLLFPGHVYPNIRIEMAEAANDVLCDMLRKGSLDIAIADFKDNEEGISMIDLYTENTLLLIPRVLFEQVFGETSSQIIQELQAGDLQSRGTKIETDI